MGKAERSRAPRHGIRALSEAAPSPRRAAQGVDALRHGWPIHLDGGPVLQPIETCYDDAIASETLLISASRAGTLKLANQRDAAIPGEPVLLRGAERFSRDAALAVADPALDLAHPMKGPFKALPHDDWADQARAALDLARIAGILPAFLVAPEGAEPPVALTLADARAYADPANLIVAFAAPPIRGSMSR